MSERMRVTYRTIQNISYQGNHMKTTNGKLRKKSTKKELETKRLRKKWRELGYHKVMPFGNFRLLANRTNIMDR